MRGGSDGRVVDGEMTGVCPYIDEAERETLV